MTSAELASRRPAASGGAVLSPAHRHAAPAVFAAALCWFALLAWLRPLTNPDEGRYVGVALDMLLRGDWIVPRLDGLPFFHKPPLFYWLGAASMGTFGVSELAARLPSLLGASLAVASIFVLVRRWAGPLTATVSALVLASMPYFYIGAQFANLDMLVAGLITATIATAAHATLRREAGQPWRRVLALAYALAALALLAKGLIGLVLPGAVYFIWSLARRRLRLSLPLLLFWPGWLAFAAIALPWLVAMQLRFDSFFDYFIITQHFRRFAGSGFNNAHPFWFFVPVIAALTLPWPLWLAAGARRMVARGPAVHGVAVRGPQLRARWSDLDTLMLVWVLVIVGFFSIPSSKLVGYVLPALAPLAVLVARCVLVLAPGSWRDMRRLRWSLACAGLLCLASAVGLAMHQRAQEDSVVRHVAGMVGANDRVIMLDDYFYDVPFYWRRTQDAYLAADWREQVATARDNWRKEIWDAAAFDAPRARRLLISPGDAARLVQCGGVTWVVGRTGAQPPAWLAGARLAATQGALSVWRGESQNSNVSKASGGSSQNATACAQP